ncbi:MAG: hypothetical protein U0992_09315 [Planctomycetaceae bacterium]
MCASNRLVLLVAAAGLAATIAVLWFSDVPLGVPGEWVWRRIHHGAEHVWGWTAGGAAAAVYILFVVFGGMRIETRGAVRPSAWLCLLAAAGFTWLWVIQSSVPGIAGLPKTQFVLYYKASSGYFWQARREVQDTREFLAGYEELLAERDYLHIGTHPPGLTLLFRGLLRLFAEHPGLTDVVLATEPAFCREAAATMRATELTSGRILTPTDEAVLWLAALLAQAAAAVTVIPLFVLLALCVDRRTAWFVAALWPLVPGIAVFLPKSDAVFPLVSTLGPCLWLVGWRRRSILYCVLAGATLFAGMFLSLAIAPVAVLTGLATVIGEWTLWGETRPVLDLSSRASPPLGAAADSGATRRGEGEVGAPRAGVWWWALSVLGAAFGFFVPVILLWRHYDLNLPRVWSWNVANHALFYEKNVRTWWKWLLVNPVEAGLAAGGPLAMLALLGAVRSRATRLFPLVAAAAIVWGLLWLSGKNMGEAARLWLLFQPWVVVAAAAALRDTQAGSLDLAKPSRMHYVWIAVLALQAAACIATVTRVDGFELSPA